MQISSQLSYKVTSTKATCQTKPCSLLPLFFPNAPHFYARGRLQFSCMSVFGEGDPVRGVRVAVVPGMVKLR